jgi:carboxypeptidase Taq
MREHVHRHGRKFEPNRLIEKATGRPITAAPYLGYLHAKFGEMYGVKV